MDVTADARDAARAAFYGAVASPLDASVATGVENKEEEEEEEDRIGPVPEPEEFLAGVRDEADAMTAAPIETLAATAFDTSRPFVSSIGERDLVYFLLNVGDGDTQLILLPDSPTGRRAIVVDCATSKKLPALVAELGDAGLLTQPPPGKPLFELVVGTHPHEDHVGGMRRSFWTRSATTSESSGSRATSIPPPHTWR